MPDFRLFTRSNINIFILFVIFLGLCAVAAIGIYADQDTVPAGVTVSGRLFAGLSYAEARMKLKDWEQRLAAQSVTLASSDRSISTSSFSLSQLGLRTNADAIIAEWESVLSGSTLRRFWQRWEMRHRAFQLDIAFEEADMKQAVGQRWSALQNAQPVDARRVITSDDRIRYISEKKVTRIDTALMKLRLERLVVNSLGKESTVEENLVEENLVKAPFSGHPLRLELPIRIVEPKVTVKSLMAQGIRRKIGQFTTKYRPGEEGRIHNIRSAAAVMHDQILHPGEVFDYGEIIQQTKKKFGFKKAPVIFNGNIVPGIGGGICQVSTTLYNAALRSGIEIVERRNHSVPISYAPLGQDATFAEGYINFKLRNNTGAYLLIRTEASEDAITVKLFGNLPEEVSYEIKSNIVKTIDPSIKYVKNTSLAPGEQQLIRKGKPGYLVETHRYKKVKGATVSEELISEDRYKPQPSIIAVNNGKDSPQSDPSQGNRKKDPSPSLLEDGISGPVFD
jgi:vancomycin resistance protein YoaR